MNFICRYLGGSHLYGLNTPDSDLDERGVYLTPEIGSLLGFTKDESKTSVTEESDYSYFELKYFLQLLKKTNTNSIECLFAPRNAFSVYTSVFKTIQTNAHSLINSEKLLKSLQGYIQNEARLALGERTGRLGGKRKASLDQYGFSPKNVSHMIRLAYCAGQFFRGKKYPVSLKDTPVFNLCLELKTKPEHFSLKQIESIVETEKKNVLQLEDHQKMKFDDELASEIVLEGYKGLLEYYI